MIPLPPDLAAFLSGGVSVLAGSRDAELRPRLTRAVGLRVGEDRASVTVYVADRAGASLLATVTPGAPLAVTVAQVPTHRSVQLKGTVTGLRPARDDERPGIEVQAGGFLHDLSALGFPLPVVRRLVTWPATAIEVRLEASFEQTPGPGAGGPMGSA